MSCISYLRTGSRFSLGMDKTLERRYHLHPPEIALRILLPWCLVNWLVVRYRCSEHDSWSAYQQPRVSWILHWNRRRKCTEVEQNPEAYGIFVSRGKRGNLPPEEPVSGCAWWSNGGIHSTIRDVRRKTEDERRKRTGKKERIQPYVHHVRCTGI